MAVLVEVRMEMGVVTKANDVMEEREILPMTVHIGNKKLNEKYRFNINWL